MEAAPERKAYDTDLTDEEWAAVEPLLPPPQPGGRKRTTNIREVLNAIFYLLRTGVQWSNLPHDFPPEGTVRDYFHRWKRSGTWQTIHDSLRRLVRVQAGRNPQPTAGCIDSQTTKATATTGSRGYDAGKKINGRKRHILVDTLGLILIVVVHVASIQDRDGAKLVFEKVNADCQNLELVWADGGYAGKLVEWTKTNNGFTLEIVKRSDDVKGFKLLPHRWVVERTLSWISNCRRLSKDYEYHECTSEALIHLSMTRLMLRRLTEQSSTATHCEQQAA